MQHPGFNICTGPDPVLLKDYIEDQLARHPAENGLERERHVFWGDEGLGDLFWEKLTLQGLFARPRAIILRNAQNIPADSLKVLSRTLGGVGQEAWLFVCLEVEREKNKFKVPAHIAKLRFYTFAEEKGWLKEIPALDHKGVKAFALKEAARLGLTVPPALADQLCSALPPDAGAIKLEMEKIALASPDGRVDAGVLGLLDYKEDINIFAFLQNLQSGSNPAQVWSKFMSDNEASSDSGLFSFIAMLLREARIMWQLLAGEPAALPPYVIQSKTALARRMGHGGLARIWELALTADKGVKTGEQSPQQAFERLIADLFRLFGSKR